MITLGVLLLVAIIGCAVWATYNLTPFPCPSFCQRNLLEAKALAKENGIRIYIANKSMSVSGIVSSQDPPAGSMIPRMHSVSIVVD